MASTVDTGLGPGGSGHASVDGRGFGDAARSTRGNDRGGNNDPFRKNKKKKGKELREKTQAERMFPDMVDNSGNQSGLGGNQSDAARRISARRLLKGSGGKLSDNTPLARTARKLLLGQ